MDKVLQLLRQVRPDLDFNVEKCLVDDGILDSVDVLSIVSGLKNVFGIEISMLELDPEDFNSVETIFSLVERKTKGQ